MATPSNRFEKWIEDRAAAWGETLGAWAAGFVSGGIEKIMDVIGKKMSARLKPLTDQIVNTGQVPPELKPIMDEIINPTGELAALLGNSLADKLVSGVEGDIFKFLMRSLTYGFSYVPNFYIPKADLLLDYKLRHMVDDTTFYTEMRMAGIPPERADELLKAKEVRFPSEIAGQLNLRDPAKYAKYWDDVRQLGVDPERLAALQELAYRVPGSADVIRYMVKEVYNPQTYKAFGQDQEFPGGAADFTADALTDARKSGVTREHLLKEWIAHWNLPAATQGYELLHRGLITEAELGMLLKALDIMPFWRDKLEAISWAVPNRVELRMLARYGLVDKQFLVNALEKAGLAVEYRDVLADLMLAQGMLTDLSKRYTNKWINSDELKGIITDSGLSVKIGDRLYDWITKNNAGDRLAPEKELTAAEVLKGYKKHILTYDETVEQLTGLGYDEAEAAYKIAIDTTVTPAEAAPDLAVRVDTIRRQRRQRILTRTEEISQLLTLNIDPDVADAYADNDDLRLVKVSAAKAPEVIPEYQTDAGKVNVETVRLSRRQRQISRLEEITALLDLDMSQELAVAYADNDDLRLVKETGV